MPDETLNVGAMADTPEIPLEAQLDALRGSMAIMADQHAMALLDEKENAKHWRLLVAEQKGYIDEWRRRAEELEARLGQPRPLVVLELKTDADVHDLEWSCTHDSIDVGLHERAIDVRFVGVLRVEK